MDAQSLIGQIKQDAVDIIDTAETPMSNTLYTRARILRAIQAGGIDFVGRYPWQWKRFTATVTFDDTGVAPLPGEFGVMGKNMLVTRVADNVEIAYRNPQVIGRLQQTNPNSAGPPTLYSRGGLDYLIGWPIPPVGTTIDANVTFDRDCPTFEDTDTDSGLEFIPDKYARDIIYDYGVADMYLSMGDERRREILAGIEVKIRRAWANENMQPNSRRVPRYGRSSRFRV